LRAFLCRLRASSWTAAATSLLLLGDPDVARDPVEAGDVCEESAEVKAPPLRLEGDGECSASLSEQRAQEGDLEGCALAGDSAGEETQETRRPWPVPRRTTAALVETRVG